MAFNVMQPIIHCHRLAITIKHLNTLLLTCLPSCTSRLNWIFSAPERHGLAGGSEQHPVGQSGDEFRLLINFSKQFPTLP